MFGKVVVKGDEREVDIVEIDERPDVEKGAVLTEVVQTNVCGSELHFWREEFPVPSGAVFGHEAVLEITELGDDVTSDSAGNRLSEGDLVVPVYFQQCGECRACSNGQFYACDLIRSTGEWMQPHHIAPHFRGTFATHYYIHPDQYFYKVPEGVPNEVAASANCALSQILFSVDHAGGITAGEEVIIQGAGGLGLHAIAVAKENGATVTVLEGAENRLEQAENFGADNVIDITDFESPGERIRRAQEVTGGGADLAIEVAGFPEVFDEGTRMIRSGGRYLEIGNISPNLSGEFTPANLTLNRITTYSVLFYQPWYLKRALEFLDAHIDDYPYESLLDAEFCLADAQQALEKSDQQAVTRATLVPERD
ncbi:MULTISPECIES: zinc-binding dehydrogenase [unclassified Haladaptatus]|uniref:zinc-binding dehydrogenase n=1 Tax=unclassified Haladaptatus TaxID=2622732 RepID=UPI0023E89AC1|nr:MULTISPECIES: zinc-binding dehydrogenase [unclassified Haladaptatus]